MEPSESQGNTDPGDREWSGRGMGEGWMEKSGPRLRLRDPSGNAARLSGNGKAALDRLLGDLPRKAARRCGLSATSPRNYPMRRAAAMALGGRSFRRDGSTRNANPIGTLGAPHAPRRRPNLECSAQRHFQPCATMGGGQCGSGACLDLGGVCKDGRDEQRKPAPRLPARLGRKSHETSHTLAPSRAKELLSFTSDKLMSIAERVGYEDPFSFSVAFKRETGTSPSGYRKPTSTLRHLE